MPACRSVTIAKKLGPLLFRNYLKRSSVFHGDQREIRLLPAVQFRRKPCCKDVLLSTSRSHDIHLFIAYTVAQKLRPRFDLWNLWNAGIQFCHLNHAPAFLLIYLLIRFPINQSLLKLYKSILAFKTCAINDLTFWATEYTSVMFPIGKIHLQDVLSCRNVMYISTSGSHDVWLQKK